jgi:hypothetical protein
MGILTPKLLRRIVEDCNTKTNRKLRVSAAVAN